MTRNENRRNTNKAHSTSANSYSLAEDRKYQTSLQKASAWVDWLHEQCFEEDLNVCRNLFGYETLKLNYCFCYRVPLVKDLVLQNKVQVMKTRI